MGKEQAKNMEVECYLDSELIAKQLKHEYKVKEKDLQALFVKVWNLTLDFKKVDFYHIAREKNNIADAMVNETLDAQQNKLF